MIDISSGYAWCDGSKPDDQNIKAPRRSRRWRHIGGRRVSVMKKLDQSKVEYIVAEKRKDIKNHAITESMGIAVRHVQKLWAGFKNLRRTRSCFPFPWAGPSGDRPPEASSRPCLPSAAPSNPGQAEYGTASEGRRSSFPSVWYIPYCGSRATRCSTKAGAPQMDTIRAQAFQMWHTDYKQLDD